MDAREQLSQLVTGHRAAAAIAAAVATGAIDALAEGARSSEDVAAATGTHPDTTRRLLHVLATVGVLDERGDTFELTELGLPLRSDAPASLAPQAMVQADPEVWAAWGHLTRSVRTGETAFTALHGKDVWAHRAEHPERGASFDALMTSLSSLVVEAVASSYDFSGRTSRRRRRRRSGLVAGGGAAPAARSSPGRCSTSHTSSRPRRRRTWRDAGRRWAGPSSTRCRRPTAT